MVGTSPFHLGRAGKLEAPGGGVNSFCSACELSGRAQLLVLTYTVTVTQRARHLSLFMMMKMMRVMMTMMMVLMTMMVIMTMVVEVVPIVLFACNGH